MALFEMPDRKKNTLKEKGAALVVNGLILPELDNKIHSVLEAIKERTPCITWYSNGEWNMIDLLIGTLALFGSGDVYISSYGFSDNNARRIAELKNKSVIRFLFCILDNRIDTRSASALNIVQLCSTQYKLCRTHAKVTIIETEFVRVACVGSANYTENKRYEAGVIFTDHPAVDFHLSWIQKELKA